MYLQTQQLMIMPSKISLLLFSKREINHSKYMQVLNLSIVSIFILKCFPVFTRETGMYSAIQLTYKNYVCYFYLISLVPLLPTHQIRFPHSTQSHLSENKNQVISFVYQKPHITFRVKPTLLKAPLTPTVSDSVLLNSPYINHHCLPFTLSIQPGLFLSFEISMPDAQSGHLHLAIFFA